MFPSNTQAAFQSRRSFLQSIQYGLGATAAAAMMLEDATLGQDGVPSEAMDPPPHHPAKARRVIQIVLTGGYSQVDTFDYKPELPSLHGKTLNEGLGREEKPDVFFGKVVIFVVALVDVVCEA